MNELPKKGTKEYALADVLSRPNALNGLYKKLEFPLDWKDLHEKETFYISYMADRADKIIKEAIDSGKDMNDRKVQGELLAAFYGSATGTMLAIVYNDFLRFLGIRK